MVHRDVLRLTHRLAAATVTERPAACNRRPSLPARQQQALPVHQQLQDGADHVHPAPSPPAHHKNGTSGARDSKHRSISHTPSQSLYICAHFSKRSTIFLYTLSKFNFVFVKTFICFCFAAHIPDLASKSARVGTHCPARGKSSPPQCSRQSRRPRLVPRRFQHRFWAEK